MLLVSGATRTLRRLGPSAGLGRLFVPAQGNDLAALVAGGWQWAADNGCFTGFDEAAWLAMLDKVQGLPRCLFVVVPDVVADHRATLALWQQWAPVVQQRGFPAAFVAQDGCEDIPDTAAALFIGGSTAFKESEMARSLVAFAKATGRWVHMGRVNSRRRMRLCAQWGVDSIDGSSLSRWSETHVPKAMDWAAHERAQGWLKWHSEELRA